MSNIAKQIEIANADNRKALSIFVTAGFPDKASFVDLVEGVYNSGADLVELGIPFSDPLADGPVIQQASYTALQNGVSLKSTLQFAREIKKRVDKPLVLMGYANPLLSFGLDHFAAEAKDSGVDGLIIPDVPLEEYDDFFIRDFEELDVILLTTPTSSEERIRKIDDKSRGFVYCVSVTGTTGARDSFNNGTLQKLQRTHELVSANKMLIGFGISGPESIRQVAPYCDGLIVGSAVIRRLMNTNNGFDETLTFVRDMGEACESVSVS